MTLYHASIQWTNDPGNNVIVGVFDRADKAIAATEAYYRDVRGEAVMTRDPDYTHSVYGTQVIGLRFRRDYAADERGDGYSVTGTATIFETPINQTFPGSIMAARV